jgi:MinD-like ATPase involved in chromosome partitioning or flagellar assembly
LGQQVFDTAAEALMNDQAAGLRALTRKAVRLLPVTSAARGVGHTTCVVNLAAAFSASGLRVVVIDAGRAMVAPSLGLKAKYDLFHVLTGERTFSETIQSADTFSVLPAAKGLDEFVSSGSSAGDLFGAFTSLFSLFDMVILAAPPAAVSQLLGPAGDVLIVLNDEADSIKATYGFLKKLSEESGFQQFQILFNDVQDVTQANDGYARLADAAKRFFNAHLSLAGIVPRDAALRRAGLLRSHVFRRGSPSGNSTAKVAFSRAVVDVASWQLHEFSAAQE